MDDYNLQVDLDHAHAGAFLRALGLHFDKISPHEVRAHLNVTSEHHTPWGITHGGVYATVLESVTSVGASAAVAESGGYAVGVNNQTDFLRPHREGRLDVLARPVHQGRTLQLWTADITDTDSRLIARGQVRLFNQLPES
jgi:uncharacterized protein (TIGR00369 family)